MKLRIEGDSIRLWLTRQEAEVLGRGDTVEETTHFPDGAVLRCRLEVAAEAAMLSAHYAWARSWCGSDLARRLSGVLVQQSGLIARSGCPAVAL